MYQLIDQLILRLINLSQIKKSMVRLFWLLDYILQIYQGAQHKRHKKRKMSHVNYNNSIPRTFDERPFAAYNKQTSPQHVPLNLQTNKITFNQPQTNLNQPVGQTKTYHYPQTYMQGNNVPKTAAQNQSQTGTKKITTAQTINTAGLGSVSTVGKKFIPLSYEKVSVYHQGAAQSTTKDKDYTKKTILTVLLGFLVLIVIVGVFYGFILYDKSRNSSESVAGNVVVSSSGVKSSSVSAVEVNKKDWKTLPEDESSPLGFLEHDQNGDNVMSHQSESSLGNTQAHLSFTHIRRHIQ